MLGFLGLWGRGREMVRLDDALAAAGVPDGAVPDSAKLTLLKLLRREAPGGPSRANADTAAALVAYCLLDGSGYAAHAGPDAAAAVADRVDDAAQDGDSLDAQIVMLCLGAGLAQPGVIDRHGLEMA